MFFPSIRVAAGFVLTVSVGFSIYALTSDRSDEAAVEKLLLDKFADARTTGGRLFGVPYSEFAPARPLSEELNRAQFLLGTLEQDSDEIILLQAYSDIAMQAWRSAAARLERHAARNPGDPRVLNDLGVVYLELAENDPSALPRALNRFLSAAALAPMGVEPVFNLALTYRRLHLPMEQAAALELYGGLSADDGSVQELIDESESSDQLDVPGLKTALAEDRIDRAWAITRNSPDSFWQVLLEVAVNRVESFDEYASIVQIVELFEQHFHDETPRAIVSPLVSERRDRVSASRKAVFEALGEYRQGNLDDSLGKLTLASRLAEESGSDFDRSWARVARANVLISTQGLSEARELLDSVVETTRHNGQKWLLARTLTVFGLQHQLLRNRPEMIERLEEAIDLYESVGANVESAGTRFYLATHLHREGSATESMRIAGRALDVTPDTNHAVLSSLCWVMGMNLELRQDRSLAVLFAREAARQAELAGDPLRSSQLLIELAELYELAGDREEADRHVRLAEEAASATDSTVYVKNIQDLILNLGKARILTRRQRLAESEAMLKGSLPLLDRADIDIVYRHQYRLELAKVYQEQGDAVRTREEFQLAVEAVEYEDDMLAPPARLAFDQQRRDVFEFAIAFEFDQGELDRAWQYAQRYREKLITEMLDQYSPREDGFADRVSLAVRDNAPPEDLSLVEYTMLEDRLLIWVGSSAGRTGREHPVSRDVLTMKVGRFLELQRDQSASREITELAKELHRALIAPIADLLDGTDVVSIVPDRVLNRLPFDALMSTDGRYFAEDHTLLETPSTAYFMSPLPAPAAPGTLVAMGSRAQDSSIRAELEEVSRIHRGMEVLDQFEVDGDVFLEAVDGASLFHYSGHSAIDGANALMSSIQLDGAGSGPNAVTAMEIANRRLAANAVVVLASCDSSVGNSTGGVGVRGLT